MIENTFVPGDAARAKDLIARLTDRADAIGERLAQRYCEEIVEYRALRGGFIEQDIAPTARRNLIEMLTSLAEGRDISDERIDWFRESAVRRYHQGVPLQALLHAYRLWGHTVWEEIIRVAESIADPYAALAIAGGVMKHVDLVSTAVAQAYLEEASGTTQDREQSRRRLLEALVTGTLVTSRLHRQAAALDLDLSAQHIVVLVRHRELSNAEPDSLRAALRTVRDVLATCMLRPPLTHTRNTLHTHVTLHTYT